MGKRGVEQAAPKQSQGRGFCARETLDCEGRSAKVVREENGFVNAFLSEFQSALASRPGRFFHFEGGRSGFGVRRLSVCFIGGGFREGGNGGYGVFLAEVGRGAVADWGGLRLYQHGQS